MARYKVGLYRLVEQFCTVGVDAPDDVVAQVKAWEKALSDGFSGWKTGEEFESPDMLSMEIVEESEDAE